MHVAVVMPAFNEVESLREFVPEILAALAEAADRITVVVVDDCSSDGLTVDLFDTSAVPSEVRIEILRNEVNLGHGPSALRAYVAGYESGAEAVVHVDGDGQFLGADVARVLAGLAATPVVHGVRRHRTDPWYRKAVSLLVMVAVCALARVRVVDVNTPLRAYRRVELARLLRRTNRAALVPHVHFSILERRWGFGVTEIKVRSVPRRGRNVEGSMWGGARSAPRLPPLPLLRFIGRAGRELWRFRVRGTDPQPVALETIGP